MFDLIIAGMLTSIDLNNEPAFEANKVSNVGTDGMLPAKSETTRFAITERTPKFAFRYVHRFAQIARALVGHAVVI